jgi:hypothetical protein
MKRHISASQQNELSTTIPLYSEPEKKKTKIDDECQKLVFWGQYGETCWFNALLMSVFYSQRSRQYIIEASKKWKYSYNDYLKATQRNQKIHIKLNNLFKHILEHKYRKSKDFKRDFAFFKQKKAEYILDLLNKFNSLKFMVNDYKNGGNAYAYIKQFYNFLGLSCFMIEVDDIFNCTYSLKNYIEFAPVNTTYTIQKFTSDYFDEFAEENKSIVIDTLNSTPDILVVRYHPMYRNRYIDYINQNLEFFNLEYDTTNNNAKEITSLKEIIQYNNTTYELDSIILENYDSIIIEHADKINKNIEILSHQIAGITCNDKKYIYNGWTLHTEDPNIESEIQSLNEHPCPLIPYSWHSENEISFCIDQEKCGIKLVEQQQKLCFSFSKGPRIFVYVKQSTITSEEDVQHKTPEHIPYRSVKTPSRHAKKYTRHK